MNYLQAIADYAGKHELLQYLEKDECTEVL